MKPANCVINALVIVFCCFNNLTSAQIKRSMVDFSDQNNISKATGKRLAIINDLRAATAILESPYTAREHWWQDQDLQQPIKCFVIAAAMHLGIDLIKCATQGRLKDTITDPNVFLVLLTKVVFQGGMPGMILGGAGTWGKLPQLSTPQLVSEMAISQLILECFDRLCADLHRSKKIDSLTYLLGTSIAAPTASAIIHSMLLWAQREDLQQEKHLISATLRELGSSPAIQNAVLVNQ